MQIPPGSANASKRAATLTPSPKMSCSSAITSPRLNPDAEPDSALFGYLRLAIIHPALDLDRAAHGVDDTRKFRSKPSPVFFTVRPRCSVIFGSTSCPKCALRRACVPSSSSPMRREYPATSAARIAASRRVEAIARVGPLIEHSICLTIAQARASRHAPDAVGPAPDGL